eukprot:3815952-Amphidinium_carterae.1
MLQQHVNEQADPKGVAQRLQHDVSLEVKLSEIGTSLVKVYSMRVQASLTMDWHQGRLLTG